MEMTTNTACRAFDKLFPVGTQVRLRRDRGWVETEVQSVAYLLGGHTPVAHFKGVRGCHAIENRVEPLDVEARPCGCVGECQDEGEKPEE